MTSYGTFASNLLATVKGLYAPDRFEQAYVSPGAPAFDGCDQVSVHISFVTPIESAKCTAFYQPQFIVTITGCVPTVTEEGLPSTEAMDQAGIDFADDIGTLITGCCAARQAKTLFGAGVSPDCSDITMGLGQMIDPSGGQAGFFLPITIKNFN